LSRKEDRKKTWCTKATGLLLFKGGRQYEAQIKFQAGEHKAQHSVSYADCFVLASALEHDATIVTGDPEFTKGEHLVGIVRV